MASPYPHYAWAGGHFLLLAAALRYLFAWITFKSVAYAFWYKRQSHHRALLSSHDRLDANASALCYPVAFSGALASYAIVV